MSYWGDGIASSLDGMRVQVDVVALHANASPYNCSGK
ncbi:hypothetical protein [Brevibacillus centrosporus]